jgi:uncharacterized protein (TIGR03067 family)
MFLDKLKVLALSVAVIIAVDARHSHADEKDAPKDEEKILGTWTIVSWEEGGEKVAQDVIKGVKVTFAADGKMTVKQGEKEQEFTYQLDPAQKPKAIDGTNAQGQTVLGIYKLDRDSLTICYARGGDRPTEFASKKDTSVGLQVLKREK